MLNDIEDEDADEDAPNKGRVWRIIGGLGAVAAVGGMVTALMMPSHKPPPPQQQTMRVVLPPPPPPPKKPPEPEPQKQTEVVKNNDPSPVNKPMENKPDSKPNPAPKSAPLTAAAGAGANAYGLAVGNGGGGSIGGGGGGGGGGGSRFGAYAGQLQVLIEQALRRDEKTQSGSYHLSLRIWLTPSGAVQRVAVSGSTGDQALDREVVRVLSAMVASAPPADMPQPVNLRVRARAS